MAQEDTKANDSRQADIEWLQKEKGVSDPAVAAQIIDAAYKDPELGQAMLDGYRESIKTPAQRAAPYVAGAVEYGVPIAVGVGSGILSVNPAAGYAAGLVASPASNAIAQKIRMAAGLQQGFDQGDFAASSVSGMIPLGVGKFGVGKTALKTLGKSAGINYGAFLASENARTLVNEGRAATPSEMLNPIGVGASVLGGVLPAAGQFAKGRSARIAEIKAEGLTPSKLPLAMYVDSPFVANRDAAKYSRDPEAMLELSNALKPLTEGDTPFSKILAQRLSDADVNDMLWTPKQMADRLSKLQGEEGALAQARAQAKAAADAVAEAEKLPVETLSRQDKIKLWDAKFKADINELNLTTRLLKTARMDFDGVTHAGEIANAWSDSMSNILSRVSEYTDGMYKGLGVTKSLEVLNADELANAVAKRLGPDARTESGRKIIETIKGMADKQSVEIDGKLVDVPRSGPNVNEAQIREFRSLLSGKLADPAGNKVASAEAMASEAYDEIRNVRYTALANAGIDTEALKRADSAYSIISQAKENSFVKSLLNKQIADSKIAGLGPSIARGEFQDAQAFLDFASTASPEVLSEAKATLIKGARDSIISNSVGEYGNIDHRKLADNLLRFNTFSKGGKSPFLLTDLGFGDETSIRNLARSLREIDPKSRLNPNDVADIFTDPDVTSALSQNNRLDPKLVEQKIAKKLFLKDVAAHVKEQISMENQGLAARSIEKNQKLMDAAKKANMTLEQVQEEVNTLRSDPFVSFLSESGGYGIVNPMGGGTKRFIETLVQDTPENVGRFVNQLKVSGRNAQAEAVTQAVISKAFDAISYKARTGNVLDVAKFDALFRSALSDKNSPAARALYLIKSDMPGGSIGAFERTAKLLNRLQSIMERGGQVKPGEDLAQIAGVMFGARGVMQQGLSRASYSTNTVRTFTQRMFDTANNFGYGVLTTILADKKMANAAWGALTMGDKLTKYYTPVQLYTLSKQNPIAFNALIYLGSEQPQNTDQQEQTYTP